MAARSERRNLAYEAAVLYLVEQQTVEAIVNKLGILRSTISRLIVPTRDEDLVRISLHASKEPRDSLSHRVEDLYDIDVTVVQVPGATTETRRPERVAGMAGNLVGDVIEDRMMVGIAWGTTVSTISERLMPKRASDVTIVQFDGAASPTMTDLPYVGETLGSFTRAFGAKAFPFPVPTFFNYAETRDLVRRERSVQVIRDIGRNADVAVFGVDSFTSPLPSHVCAGGYLSPEGVAELRRGGVVDDACMVLFHTGGTYEDIEINTRMTGPTPTEPARIPRRICAITGVAKVSALAAAPCSDAVTDLAVNDEYAVVLLEVEKGGRAESDYGAWS